MKIIIKRAEVIELMETTKELREKVDGIFNDEELREYYYFSVDRYVDVILDLLNIPTDTSVEYDPDDEDYFVRDIYYSIMYDYIFDYTNYNEEEIVDMLLTFNE
ncbi:MAG: hypothetical protein ACOCRK_03050 [bacterium]